MTEEKQEEMQLVGVALEEAIRAINPDSKLLQAMREAAALTPKERVQRAVDQYNAQRGHLDETTGGYDCKKCLNRGDRAVLEERDGAYYDVYPPCECMKIRRSIWRIMESGLAKTMKEQTLKTFDAKADWQKHMLDSAQRYISDGAKVGAWFFVGGQVGCVDADTEYFNGTAWKRIAEYDGGMVLTYDAENRNAQLQQPTRYIVQPAGKMYEIKTVRGSISQVLSSDHSFAYITTKGHMQKKRFDEVMKMHNETTQGFYGRIATTFNYSGDGIELTDNEIRLMCAVIADGSFRPTLKMCIVNVKKERKKERMRLLLQGTKYKEYHKSNGFSDFRFYAPRREKVFTEYWYGCSNRQMQVIVDEVFNWDGSKNGARRQYYTVEKQNADFIQFALAACGIRSTISVDCHRQKPCFKVIACSNKPEVMMASTGGKNKAEITEYIPKDGKQYCFTVETGYLVLRRNGRIFITGNCGKTHLCTGIARELLYSGMELRYMVWGEESKKLKALAGDVEYAEELRKWQQCDVLYIDDLFKPVKDDSGRLKPPTDADVRLSFDLLNYRYINRMATIISSERFSSEIVEIDEAVGSRIYERAKDYCEDLKRDAARNHRLLDNTLI